MGIREGGADCLLYAHGELEQFTALGLIGHQGHGIKSLAQNLARAQLVHQQPAELYVQTCSNMQLEYIGLQGHSRELNNIKHQ